MNVDKLLLNRISFLSWAIFSLFLSLPAFAQAKIAEEQNRIQLAILLDTSSSMDGLINQTRSQIWSMINELSKARKNQQAVSLEVAIIEYGNSNLSRDTGFLRTVNTLNSDLDLVSESLFSLKTNGGDEFCGYAIKAAVNKLQWSAAEDDLKLIYIAGNEAFSQGPVNYEEAISLAAKKGISVSTIFAGAQFEGAASGWRHGAQLAGGNFMSVNQNEALVHIDAPQDKQIAALNAKLNTTYVPYGTRGKEAQQRQTAQDKANESMSKSMLSQRAKSKVSSAYKNANWDLVDAMEEDDFQLSQVPDAALPKEMSGLAEKDKVAYLSKKKVERKRIKQEIKVLSQKRDDFVKEEQQKQAETDGNSVKDVLVNSIKNLAEKSEYSFIAEN